MNGEDAATDAAIKLFGRKIPFPDSQNPAGSEVMEGESEAAEVEAEGLSASESKSSEKSPALTNDDDDDDDDEQSPRKPNDGRTRGDAEGGDEGKPLKKPDKILPCPRCHSSETKFCYFNNYNVNQPRHFCKNCQRYWTAGGTTRNVPVGAGRRKNKQLASHYRQIILSADALPAYVGGGSGSSSYRTPSAGNGGGMVLKFGPDQAPLCQSMASVLDLSGETSCVGTQAAGASNATQKGYKGRLGGPSALAASNFMANGMPENVMQMALRGSSLPGHNAALPMQPPIQCYPVPPWVIPVNPNWNGVTPAAGAAQNFNSPNPVQWCSPQMIAVPGFCGPNVPLQLVPAAPSYWGCLPFWGAGAGDSNGFVAPTASAGNSCITSNLPSSSLGKHPRDPNLAGEERLSKGFSVPPKVVGSDDPNEASWTSLWSTLAMSMKQKEAAGTKASAFASDSFADLAIKSGSSTLSHSRTFQERT